MYSIIIPTFKNHKYLELCLRSIIQNSYYKTHQICVHIDGYDEPTISVLNKYSLPYTLTSENIGPSHGFNILSTQILHNVVVGHDDCYFTKNWDLNLHKWELELNRRFPEYMKIIGYKWCEPNFGSFPPICNAGKCLETFNEELLNNYIQTHSSHTIDATQDGWLFNSLYPKQLFEKFRWSTDFHQCADMDFAITFLSYLKNTQAKFLIFSVNDVNVYHFQTVATPKSKLPKNGCEKFMEKWNITLDEAWKIIKTEVDRSIKFINR